MDQVTVPTKELVFGAVPFVLVYSFFQGFIAARADVVGMLFVVYLMDATRAPSTNKLKPSKYLRDFESLLQNRRGNRQNGNGEA